MPEHIRPTTSDTDRDPGESGPQPAQSHKTPPPDALWICSLQGRIPSAATRHLPHFLGTWEEDDLSFLFFTQPAPAQVRALIQAHPQVQWLDAYQVPYADWVGGDLHPFTVGRVHVRPVWCPDQVPSDLVSFDLNPGVVFGGGSHQTTLDCLRALNFIAQQDRTLSVLDLGSGTGILALAASKLGWPRVVAVDLNPLAARTTQANIHLNGLQDRVLAVQARAEDLVDIPAQVVVANIHYQILARILPLSGFKQKRWFVLSGLMRSQVHPVLDRLQTDGALIEAVLDDGTWFTVIGRRTLPA